jgi:hypothetical protein
MSDVIKDIMDKMHASRMSDPIYVEGYNAPNHWVDPWPANPYTFDTETGLKLSRIAMVERALTEEEKTELVRLRTIIDNSEWNRWELGNYRRWCVEKA